jgi:hypothetical protein
MERGRVKKGELERSKIQGHERKQKNKMNPRKWNTKVEKMRGK